MLRRALLVLALGVPLAAPAQQAQRNFPHNALRGELMVIAPPNVVLNGQPARLAPGARIRGRDNMLAMSSALVGQRHVVNYTLDPLGLVKDVWLLQAHENRSPWPKTAAEAARWQFDPLAQTWTKR
jgi:hypothetical protein